jgi:hypothetical protein
MSKLLAFWHRNGHLRGLLRQRRTRRGEGRLLPQGRDGLHAVVRLRLIGAVTRCEQMFSAILPTADIRRTERDVRQHFSGLPASRFERASRHVEAVPLYRDNAGLPHGLRDRTSRLRRRRLQLIVGTEGELLSDRGGQNSQSY